MHLVEVIRALNRLESDGVIRRYALGGAVAAAFYAEGTTTYDVDAFVSFMETDNPFLTLLPVLKAVQDLGGRLEREYVILAETPLQLLPATSPAAAEAIEQAVAWPVPNGRETVLARVMPAEYLAVLALETGRPKDSIRLLALVRSAAFDHGRFTALLAKFDLLPRWQTFLSKHGPLT